MKKLEEIAAAHDLLVRGTDEPDECALAALREVRNEALEGAAKVAREHEGICARNEDGSKRQEEKHGWYVGRLTAKAIDVSIRALKEQP